MSFGFGTGPPAPPPLRKSRWSWWKPVKGTSATTDYYYNVNNSNRDSRPRSSSSAAVRPGSSGSISGSRDPSKLQKGRNSLSVLDDKRAEVLREEVYDYIKHGLPPMASLGSTTVTTGTGPGTTSATSLARCDGQPTGKSSDAGTGSNLSSGRVPPRSKNNRKSTSRPPLAWYNRPYHQRFLSEPVLLPQPVLRYENENERRRLDAQQEYLADKPLPASPSVDMGASKGPVVTVPPVVGQPRHSRWNSGYNPPASQVLAIQIEPQPKQEYATKEGSRPSSFYPAAPEELAVEVNSPAARGQAANEKSGSRGPRVGTLMAPTMDPAIATEALPIRASRTSMDVRSRRSSSSTVASFSTALSSGDSLDSRGRASSWGSQTSLESAASSPLKVVAAGRRSYADYQTQLQNQPQNVVRTRNQRPSPIKKAYRPKAKPGELLAALPGELLEMILEELKKLHLQPGSDSCATCWMRDCCSVALSARKWYKFARTALYEDIQLVGQESGHLKKRYKISHGGRLVLLRRTLRNAPYVAAIVRSLKVPQASMLPAGIAAEEHHDLVASVVMACPNLERLVGFYPSYDHSFSRLFHALSTRQRLKEMNWVVEPSSHQRQQHRTSPSINDTIAPSDLQPLESEAFYDHHVNWTHLTSLTVHCRPGATLGPDALLNDALSCLPALQTLHLSHLPDSAFNDKNLLSLPALKKLTLSHLAGVSTAGLSSFATRRSSSSLTSLALIGLNVDSLQALARTLSNLTSLTTFALVQPCAPALAADERVVLFPYLASATLRKLHWDVPGHHPATTTRAVAAVADTVLARSISAGGFPRLRALRAPHDPEGVFQAVCRPRECVDLPADRYRYATCAGPGWSPSPRGSVTSTSTSTSSASFSNHHQQQRRPSSQHGRTRSRGSSFGGGGLGVEAPPPAFAPPAGAVDLVLPPRENSDLHAARLAAQGRLEAARRAPRLFINVVDEDGAVVEKFGVGGYLGDVRSRIEYLLLPDAGGTDEGGGLVGVAEMLGDDGEEIGVIAPEPGPAAGSSGATVGGGGKRASGVLSKMDRARERSRSRDRGRDDPAVKVRTGCTGRWNAGEAGSDKKDRDRWMHAERGRWRGLVLS